MEFELDKPRKEIQKAVREFSRGKFDKEAIIELLRNGEFPRQIWADSAELGFSGIHFPEEFEGGGLGLLEYALVAEEMCRKDSSMGIALMLAGHGAENLFRFAGNQLSEKYLPAIASGKTRCAAALFENPASYDLSGIKTSAQSGDGGWIINGKKTFVPNGGSAGFYVVLCKTEPDENAPEKAFSLIAADADSAGITAAPAGPSLGSSLIDFADVTFKDLHVPEENLVGKQGRGLAHALDFMDESRIQIAAMALGTAQGAFDRAADHVRKRRQFGRKLADFQVIRHKLAEMSARIEEARWVVYNAASAFDKNRCGRRTAASAKLSATAAAMAVTDEAVQLLGGYGYMTEYEIEHFYRDAKTLQIFTGPPAVLKDTIAENLTGRLK